MYPHDENDDWDYGVPTVRSWDYGDTIEEPDLIAFGRAAVAANTVASLAASAVESVRANFRSTPCSSEENKATNRRTRAAPAWTADLRDRMMCGAVPTTRSCIAQNECRQGNNSLVSDDVYFAAAPNTTCGGGREVETFSVLREGTECGREQAAAVQEEDSNSITFDEPEPPPPMRTPPRSFSGLQVLLELPPDLVRNSPADESRTTRSSGQDSASSCSSEPPPPPPPRFGRTSTHEDIFQMVQELKRDVSDVNRLASNHGQCSSIVDNDAASIVSLSTISLFESTEKLQRVSAKRVRFAHPVVTSLKHRPISTLEEKQDLYFTSEELYNLEKDREHHDQADDFEVEIFLEKLEQNKQKLELTNIVPVVSPSKQEDLVEQTRNGE